MIMTKIKAIDLFSGCGGVSCGLIQGGFQVVCALEIDSNAVNAYKNYPPLAQVAVLQKDICDTKGTELLKAGKIRKDELYLLAGCPPCQNFSLQNRQNKDKSDEEKKKLLMQFLRIIKEIYPPFILMENVPGIQTAGHGEILKEFLSELENEKEDDLTKKYKVVKDVLNAANYGVPQTRKRFVLHAVRKDVYELMKQMNLDLRLPVATHSATGKDGLKKWKTVRDAIADLPAIKAGERYSDDRIKNHYCANLSVKNLERIKAIRTTGGSRTGLPANLVLPCHSNGYEGHKDVYGIMDMDKPAPTMTGGCVCYSKGRFGHPTQDRAISVREAARIQTFPDDYTFGESITKAALEIGNAVPVELVKVSAEQILKQISAVKKYLTDNKKKVK